MEVDAKLRCFNPIKSEIGEMSIKWELLLNVNSSNQTNSPTSFGTSVSPQFPRSSDWALVFLFSAMRRRASSDMILAKFVKNLGIDPSE